MSETTRPSLFEQFTGKPQLSVGERASERTFAVVEASIEKSARICASIKALERYQAAIDVGVPRHKAWELLTLDADDIASVRQRILNPRTES